QEDVLESDPARMLEPSKRLDRGSPVNRAWKESAPSDVVDDDDDRGSDEDAIVTIEGDERQGSEDVKVRLDPPAREVNEQGSSEHVREGDGMPRELRAWA